MGRDFRRIVAWQRADDLAVSVYEVTRKLFPREELYGLTAQLRRAAVSVAANIAEGSGKRYLKEFLQFLYAAMASLSEVEYYLHLAGRLGYLDEDSAAGLGKRRHDAGVALNGLIESVKRQIEDGHTYN